MFDDNVAQSSFRGLDVFERVFVEVIIIVSIANFVRVDSASHSASDTLINWVPQTAILVIVGLVIAFGARRRGVGSGS